MPQLRRKGTASFTLFLYINAAGYVTYCSTLSTTYVAALMYKNNVKDTVTYNIKLLTQGCKLFIH